ncbi:MAG: metallophosphoesterase family protein [Candidatus Latescibacteria bacterium]|jgi:predicted phosphodiesterase|nr:metallophosphoesterase family protein [Candidatus Latescibacterota bacterium]
MRRLWIADVHANLPAFEAVLRDAGSCDEVLFLGDIVGCGPHPSECINLLEGLRPSAVLGNHDAAVLSAGESSRGGSDQIVWDEWSFDRLEGSQQSLLEGLPKQLAIRSCGREATVLHNPAGAVYLHPAMPDPVLVGHLESVSGHLVIFGHSHRPIDRTICDRRFICVPPVGQPRNGDPRAGYAIECDGHLTFHFVAYDVERTVADVRAIGLEYSYTQRWIRFLRTGFDAEWSREYRPVESKLGDASRTQR